MAVVVGEHPAQVCRAEPSIILVSEESGVVIPVLLPLLIVVVTLAAFLASLGGLSLGREGVQRGYTSDLIMTSGKVDHRTRCLRAVLSSPVVFDVFQNLVGADGFRRKYVREFIHPAPGARILDIGCGTGAILTYLPEEI